MESLIKLVIEVIFYGAMLFLGFYSIIMIYVLLRFGKSKILGLIISVFYLILITSLYAAALENFNNIPFSQF